MLSRRLLRIKVVKTLYAHFRSESDSLIGSERNLTNSVNKTYDLYHQMLSLVTEVAKYAEERVELGKKKRLPTPEDLNPNTKFIDNALITQLKTSEDLNDYLTRYVLGWGKFPELVKSLYNSMIEAEFYKVYMAAPEKSYHADVQFVKDFYLQLVEDNELLEDILEEQSILWSDDLDFSLIMVIKTFSACKVNQGDMPLLPKYKNYEDEEFAKVLFRKALVNNKEYFEYIEKYTQNWDFDRIAYLDTIVMNAAIAEILAFPSIPIKVSLDEYIEIAKYYSTPGSSVFINGVLDKIVTALKAESKITKIGRGIL